jgi:hypothetical protein
VSPGEVLLRGRLGGVSGNVIAAGGSLATGGKGGGHCSPAQAHKCDVDQGVLWGGELLLTVYPGLQQAPVFAQ